MIRRFAVCFPTIKPKSEERRVVEILAGLTFPDWLGIAGSSMICTAYLAVANGWVDARRLGYHVINLAGSVLLLISLYYRPNAGAILIEVLWASIAIYALVRIVWTLRR